MRAAIERQPWRAAVARSDFLSFFTREGRDVAHIRERQARVDMPRKPQLAISQLWRGPGRLRWWGGFLVEEGDARLCGTARRGDDERRTILLFAEDSRGQEWECSHRGAR
jgi:hypothetical protein